MGLNDAFLAMNEEYFDNSVAERTEAPVPDTQSIPVMSSDSQGLGPMPIANEMVDAGPMIANVEGAVAFPIGDCEQLEEHLDYKEPYWFEDRDEHDCMVLATSEEEDGSSLDSTVQALYSFNSMCKGRF